jgi:pimeloyl-ACP methyl ester carboxylesterase
MQAMMRMVRFWLRLSGVLLCAAFASGGPSLAAPVQIEIQGLTALGELQLASGKSLKSDGAVLLLHEELAHHRMEIISALQELLRERGINSLAITLTLGLQSRQGIFDCAIEQDHRNEDAVVEIGAWVNYLKEQGASSITVAGHARGGNQVAIYAAKEPDKAVKRAILIAPNADTTTSLEADYARSFQQPLQPVLAEAEKLVAEEESTTLMTGVPFLVCQRANVTAGAFVNYYGPNQNLYTPSLLPHIAMPTLIAVGDLDPLANELTPAVQGIPGASKIKMDTIAGADHFFRDAAAEDLADHMATFLKQK